MRPSMFTPPAMVASSRLPIGTRVKGQARCSHTRTEGNKGARLSPDSRHRASALRLMPSNIFRVMMNAAGSSASMKSDDVIDRGTRA